MIKPMPGKLGSVLFLELAQPANALFHRKFLHLFAPPQLSHQIAFCQAPGQLIPEGFIIIFVNEFMNGRIGFEITRREY